jgi:hypothetical protein
MIWHLTRTGHRPKDNADVICISSKEAFGAYYSREDDSFYPYDQEYDGQGISANYIDAWCFDPCDQLDEYNAYDDFIEFSKTHSFPELLKSKRQTVIIADDFDMITKDLGTTDIKQCSSIYLRSGAPSLRKYLFNFDCHRYAKAKDPNCNPYNNCVFAEISLTQKAMNFFDTSPSKRQLCKVLRRLDYIQFCDSRNRILMEYPVHFLRCIYKKRNCLPRNRPFKFIDGDKFVAQFLIS